MRLFFAVLGLAALLPLGAADAQVGQVLQCNEETTGGIEFKDGSSSVLPFQGDGFAMEFISEVEMVMTHPKRPGSQTLGKQESFICAKPYKDLQPMLYVCTLGAEMVAYDSMKKTFTWGYLFSENISTYGAPNSFVAVGRCSAS